jgi:hypothetical protein
VTAEPMISLPAAMATPTLFEPWFRGSSWDNWRAVLKAVYALPMSEAEIAFFRSVADRDPPTKPVKEAWFVCGRGAGKDSVTSAIIAYTAALFDGGKLRPGERALVSCVAVDRDQSRIVLSYTKSYFDDVKLLRGMITRETAFGFELSNKVDVSVSTKSHRSIRGRSLLAVVFDECAFWKDETTATPDEEVYRAVGPGLARVPGSILIGISSPYRKSGLLYRKFQKHYGVNDDEVLVIRAPSRLLNPTLDEADIARRIADDPAAARAEWLAEWRDDIAGWLPYEMIEAAVDKGVTVRAPQKGRFKYHAAIDPSGGAKDSYAAAIAHSEGGVAVLDCVIEIKSPANPVTSTETISAALKEYACVTATGDKYAAAWVTDAYAKNGIRYQHSERDRSAIYQDVLPLFTSGRARLLDNQRLVSQFAGLERTTSSMGRDKIDHGKGGHDDVCNAAALALVMAGVKKGPLTITPEAMARAGRSSSWRSNFESNWTWPGLNRR